MNPNALDVVATIRIELHSSGAMSVQGNIGDVNLALAMLDHARDAIRNQSKRRGELIIPSRDVVAPQNPLFPTRPAGDMKPEEREGRELVR